MCRRGMLFRVSRRIDIQDRGRKDGRDWRMKKGRMDPSKKLTRIQPFHAGACRHQAIGRLMIIPHLVPKSTAFDSVSHAWLGLCHSSIITYSISLLIHTYSYFFLRTVFTRTLLLLTLTSWSILDTALKVGAEDSNRRLSGENHDRCTRNTKGKAIW